jgi:hypothetical protein
MPFVKGQSGNPGGRKRGQVSFAEVLRKALSERDPETKQTALAGIARAAVVKAKAGDLDAIKFVVERIDGKLPDKIDARGDLHIVVSYADRDADAP